MVERLGWSEEELLRIYHHLVETSLVFSEVHRLREPEQWVRFNQLRDEGLSFTKIAEMMEMPLYIVVLLEEPRKCIIKHDYDIDKVTDCVEGKIDP